MTRFFEINLNTKVALEAVGDSSSQAETEVVFYAKIGNPEGLKSAAVKEKQHQYEIKSNNSTGDTKGCVRIRRTELPDDTKYVLTNKVRSDDRNGSANVAQEYNVEITEEHFNAFASICSSKSIKDRYIFVYKDVKISADNEDQPIVVPELKFEVDCYPDDQGNYNEWCKIDIEIDAVLALLRKQHYDTNKTKQIVKFDVDFKKGVERLPFKPLEYFTAAQATEEQNKILDHLYKNVFSQKN